MCRRLLLAAAAAAAAAARCCWHHLPACPHPSKQDYKVHIKHTDGSFEYVPYFCLPGEA